ncbi:MAG: hypothetical protein QNJ00_13730 [Woeseiaceae bacterium]|nr:hypothetical protein [Woeseiaceae bacterium]
MRRFLKFLHTAGAIGVAGGLAAFMLMLSAAPEIGATPEYATVRSTLALVSRWLILPSMALVFLSGILSMAVHFPFQNALWVWIKLGAGFLIFESMLATIDAPARDAALAATRAVAGEIDAAELAREVVDRWGAWWTILVLAILNVALAVWRPRFRSRS